MMLRCVLLALLVACAAACGGGKAAPVSQDVSKPVGPQAAHWDYAPKAMELTLLSDPFLNAYEGAPHSLSVCVYQLQDPEAFQALAASGPGIARLLECAAFDPSVAAVQRVVVQPGRNETLTLDRHEKARFLGVACGYFDRNQGAALRIYEIPVAANTSGWLWWKETNYEPGKLVKKILLGKTGIQASGDGS